MIGKRWFATSKQRIAGFAAALIMIGLFIIVQIPFYQAVAIREGDTGRVLYSFPLARNEAFSLRYIHSIHRTPVTERYLVDEDMNLVVDAILFDSYGVGIPAQLEPGQTFREENGKFVIEHMNRRLPFFDQRIGQEFVTHTILTRGREIPLAKISPPGSWVRIQAVKESLWQYAGRRFSDWISNFRANS